MDPTVVAGWIAAGVGAATVVSTVIVQIIGFRVTRADTERQIKATHEDTADTLQEQRRQLDRTLGEQRTRTLNERFGAAADQLGSEKPAVRLAGVYAMAGLADDWKENRQVCVEVLCAYLRMPFEPDPGSNAPQPQRLAFQANREVRHTVIRVIAAHLQMDAEVPWHGLNFDFTGVVFDGGDFSGAQFSGGTVNFAGAQFSGGIVNFRFARFSGARVDFGVARFSGARIAFSYAEFSGGIVNFRRARFSSGTAYFSGAQFSEGEVDFKNAEFSGGRVLFDAQFSGSRVDFSSALFTGTELDFSGAGFSGGTVKFSDAGNWSVPPKFPWTDAPPEGVTVPAETGV